MGEECKGKDPSLVSLAWYPLFRVKAPRQPDISRPAPRSRKAAAAAAALGARGHSATPQPRMPPKLAQWCHTLRPPELMVGAVTRLRASGSSPLLAALTRAGASRRRRRRRPQRDRRRARPERAGAARPGGRGGAAAALVGMGPSGGEEAASRPHSPGPGTPL